MEAREEIRRAAETGKVVFGSRQSLKLLKLGKAKMVIVASNCPKELRESAEYYAKLSGAKLYHAKDDSVNLGIVVGKPFPVCMMVVLDPGDSKVLSLVQ